MKYTSVIAAFLGTTLANNDKCSNIFMEEAAINKVKAKSMLEVAATMIVTANTLRSAADKALPIANKALEDFEKTVTSADVTAALAKHQTAMAQVPLPEQEFNAWKEMADARMENVTATYKTYESNQRLLEAKQARLAQLEKDKIVYTAQDQMNSTDESKANIAQVDIDIAGTRVAVTQAEAYVADAKTTYEASGAKFQDADKERAKAEMRFAAVTEAAAAAEAAVTAIMTGPFQDQLEKLQELRIDAKEKKDLSEGLLRDAQRAYLSEILSTQKKEAAEAAYLIAKETCANFGGEADPAAVALKIQEEREKNREVLDMLEKEELARSNAVKMGQQDFDCRFITKWNGQTLSRPVRPLCSDGYCCGAAKASDGVVIETCQLPLSSKLTYHPMRPKNATTRKQPETLEFTCIEGAQKMAASAAALLATVYMLA